MNIVILAAGMGKRMRSRLPKVLQPLADKPMLEHVIEKARLLGSDNRLIVVVGHGAEAVKSYFAQASDLIFALQAEQLGTGHALLQALPYCDPEKPTLVLLGDVPLIRPQTLQDLVNAAGDHVGLLTVCLDNPKGYGRIVRRDGEVCAIVEEKDATPQERLINEVNTGIMVLPTRYLERWLNELGNQNAQGEYYLTDVIARAVSEGVPVKTARSTSATEVEGVNNKVQLAALERAFQKENALRLMNDGVTVIDPARIDIRGELVCGKDVTIDVGCVFSGRVVLGDGVKIGAYCVLKDVEIGAGTITCNYDGVNKFRTTIMDDAFIGSDTQLVAPVTVGKGATLGAGTTLTKDAPDGELTLARARQTTIKGWKRPTKKQ